MGRIRAGFVKRAAGKLMKLQGVNFSTKFSDNKRIVTAVAEVPTKKFRNLIAGFITKNLKKTKE